MTALRQFCSAFLVALALVVSASATSSQNAARDHQYDDFRADHVSTLSSKKCQRYGGRTRKTSHGRGCDLGAVMAVFRCSNGVMVSLLYRPKNYTILHWTGNNVERAKLHTGIGGARWIGKRMAVWERGPEAKIVAHNWESRCKKLHSM